MTAGEWTAQETARLHALADYAVAHRTPVAQWSAADYADVTEGNSAAWREPVFDGLHNDVSRLIETGTDHDAAFAWVALIATVTDEPLTHAVIHAAFGWRTAEEEASLRSWLALGPLGALAWAAGLSLAEAAAGHAAGTLDPDLLRPLAALRGWRIPAPGLYSS